jgi:hypothetical protein
MSRVTVDVHEFTHSCGPDKAPHVYDTRRTVVELEPSRPCLSPVTISAGQSRVVVDCGRARPTYQQCDACRPIVVIRTVTRTHTGPDLAPDRPVPTGLADTPCRVCGQPLAAVLAPAGLHVLCGRRLPW